MGRASPCCAAGNHRTSEIPSLHFKYWKGKFLIRGDERPVARQSKAGSRDETWSRGEAETGGEVGSRDEAGSRGEAGQHRLDRGRGEVVSRGEAGAGEQG